MVLRPVQERSHQFLSVPLPSRFLHGIKYKPLFVKEMAARKEQNIEMKKIKKMNGQINATDYSNAHYSPAETHFRTALVTEAAESRKHK